MAEEFEHRNRKKKIEPKVFAVPFYELIPGEEYDIVSTATVVKKAKYIDFDSIGKLVIYHFEKNGNLYKISEPAIRKDGNIQLSRVAENQNVSSGVCVINQHEWEWKQK